MEHTSSACICAENKQQIHKNGCHSVARSTSDYRLDNELIWAIETDDVERVRQLLDAGANVEASDETRLRTALGVAATNGNLAIVDILIAAGAKVNPSEKDNRLVEPLWFAAANRHAEIAKRLIDAGAHLEGPNGRNMFLPAIVGGDPRLVALFLNAGADPNAEFRGWPKPLIFASALGHSEIVNLLLAAGAGQGGKINNKRHNPVKAKNDTIEEMAVL